MMTRLSININEETAVVLKTRSAQEGRTVTEMIRRAVAVYDRVAQARDDGEPVKIGKDEVWLI